MNVLKTLSPRIESLPLQPFLVLLAVLSLSGCGVILLSGAAAGTVGYVSGELTATLDSTYEQVVVATDRAITENSIQEIARTEERSQISYVLKTAQGDKVQITIADAAGERASISIRVGVFGDEPLSRQILHEIESRLKS